MVQRIVWIGILSLSLAGCATQEIQRRDLRIEYLQKQVLKLETQLQQKNSEMNYLNNEMQSLKDQNSALLIKKERLAGNLISQKISVKPEDIQRALKNVGKYDGPVDGLMGKETERAIKNFQKEHNLFSDGIVGKKTWEELKIHLQ